MAFDREARTVTASTKRSPACPCNAPAAARSSAPTLQGRLGNQGTQGFIARSVQQPKVARPLAVPASAEVGPIQSATSLDGVCSTCQPETQRAASSDAAPVVKTVPPAAATPPPAVTPPAGAAQPTKRDSRTCFDGLVSENLQPTEEVPPNYKSPLARLKGFGITTKYQVVPIAAARKEGDTWHFCVRDMKMMVKSEVQPVGFREEVGSANAANVTKGSSLDIYNDLRPIHTVTESHDCGKTLHTESFGKYSLRKRYWHRELVEIHEKFHRDQWVRMYRRHLIAAEKKLRAHTVPASEATSENDAIAKARATLYSFFTDAYEATCAEYAPRQETDAYAAGAPAYQQLADAVKARAEEEQWWSTP